MSAIRVAVRAPGAASREAIGALLLGQEDLELLPPGSAARFDVLVVVGEPGEAPDGPEGGGARGVIFLSDDPGAASRLAAAELRAWGLLARGLGNKQIAWELAVSEHTVKYHVAAIYAKLGAASRTEGLRLGIERGLLSL